MRKIEVDNNKYTVIDIMDITLADSFLKNKIGNGHGEKKLYVGNNVKAVENFFCNFNRNCFFLKEDLLEFLKIAEKEYKDPTQKYQKKEKMFDNYLKQLKKIQEYENEKLNFGIYKVDVEPPRVYINSDSDYYKVLRKIGLPNLSHLSIMKLKNSWGEYEFYFKIFWDSTSIQMSEIGKLQEEKIWKNSEIPNRIKKVLVEARIGQGGYRKLLLEECKICPFTEIDEPRLLIASHIKPWCDSEINEKIDPKNGFLFTPTYDRLFDQGYITFSDDKTLVVSDWLSPANQERLNICSGIIIERLPLDDERKRYLEYHRKYIFKK